jgi:hypothetical protein
MKLRKNFFVESLTGHSQSPANFIGERSMAQYEHLPIYKKASDDKTHRLWKANIKLERLRFSIRLSHDLKLLSNEPPRRGQIC